MILTAKEATERTLTAIRNNVIKKINKAIEKGEFSVIVSLYEDNFNLIETELNEAGFSLEEKKYNYYCDNKNLMKKNYIISWKQ